jgi:hypothetical protein
MPNPEFHFHPGQRASRREFLRAAVRVPLLVAIAVVGGVLLNRRRQSGAVCTQQLVCRDCRLLDVCLLPQAAPFKPRTQP